MTDQEFPAEPTLVVDENAVVTPPPPIETNQFKIDQAAIGAMLRFPNDASVPDGWIKCEQQILKMLDYPAFSEAMGVSADETPMFQIPETPSDENHFWAMRMR